MPFFARSRRVCAVGRVFARRRGFSPSCADFRAVGRSVGRRACVRAMRTRVAPVCTHPYARVRGSFGVLPRLSV